ncbi:MAG: hypothetical protein KDD64_09770 [Bdellovibrionales bacterium]|nr:hypothetical protein [Bdellovibrionales bacterium]
MSPHSNTENGSSILWCLDVDGVLTEPTTKKISFPRTIKQLCRRAEQGDILALNTGRSLSWIEERVLPLFLSSLSEKDSIFVSAEKGALWQKFSENSKFPKRSDKTLLVPRELQEAVRKIVRENHSTFFDETKESMISLEMRDGYDTKKFGDEMHKLERLIAPFLSQYPTLSIEKSIIALDIQESRVGKSLGSLRVLEWITSRPNKVICVGDSPADLEMVIPFLTARFPTDFLYLGTAPLSDPIRDPLLSYPSVSSRYCEGLTEFLSS